MDVDLPGGITARTTIGEIAELVAARPPAPSAPWGHPSGVARPGDAMVVETVEAEPYDFDPNDLDPNDLDPDMIAEREDIEDAARARRVPYLAAAGTAAAGYAAWGCTLLAGAVGGEPAASVVATGTVVATALALPVLRKVWQHRIPDAWRTRWWLAGTAAACWVDVAAVDGPTSLSMVAALALGSVLLGARWAAEHEVPYPSQVVYEDPEPAPVAPAPQLPPVRVIESGLAVQIEQAWKARVAGGETPIAACSRLRDRTRLTKGVRWEVELDPGRGVGATTLVGCAARLALALQVSITDLVLEVGTREDRAHITVIERGALTDTPGYGGPEYRDGIVPIGMEGDCEREAEWIAWERGQGVRNGLVTGDMGSGKTAVLELVALGLRSSGTWRVWWGDGDPEGSSSNIMMEPGVADWPEAGPAGLLRQLAAFEALVESRGKRKHLYTEHPITGLPVLRISNGQREIRELPPCAEFPAYYWLLPEFFTISQDPILKEHRFVPRLEAALRRSRKFGLGASADTQSANGGDFGNSPTMRSFLNMVNALFMRTSNPGEEYTTPGGLTVSPGMLPRGGGYGLIAGRGRVAPFRSFWTPTLHDWVPSLPACHEHPDDALAIAPHRPTAEVETVSTLAQRQAEMEQWRATAQAGGAVDTAPTVTASEPAGLAGVVIPEPLGALIQFPARDVQPDKAGERPGEGAAVSARAAQVLAAMESRPGPWRSAALVAGTGLAPPAVSKALGELVSAGLAHRPAGVQGIYQAGAGEGAA